MIRLDLRPTDKWDAINQMIEVLIEEEQFPSTQRQRVLESALERERKSSTGWVTLLPSPTHPFPICPVLLAV